MNEITVKFTPATIVANIDKLKGELENRLAPFKGLVLSADQITEGKKIVADLNKEKKVISARRLEIMRAHREAADPFETGMKELEGMYDTATADMKAQIADSENKRKAEVAITLEDYLVKQWDEAGVTDEYRTAGADDLVTLTAVTTKGNPTAKTAGEIKARVNADRARQDRTEMRLLKLENESYKAGLHAPLTRNHVETFLFADDENYSIELNRIIAAEIERQKATEARIEQRNNEAAARQPEPKQEAPAAYVAPVVEPGEQATFDEEYPATHHSTSAWTVTATFHPDVPAGATAAQVEAACRKKLEAAGITTTSLIRATQNLSQSAA